MPTDHVLYETHSHTPLCKHAVGSPSEYAEVARARGLRGLFVTCHNPMPDGFASHVRMSPQQIDEYVALVDETRVACGDGVDVRLGLEADFFPGYERWVEDQLNALPFHYVLGSVHPQLPEYKHQFWQDDPRENQQVYFDFLAEAAETRLFDCLAHPDLIKNQTPCAWRPAEIMPIICRALDRIAATGVAMELNTSGAMKVVSEMNPFPGMLAEMCAREIPVTLGADAHEPDRVADRFESGLELLASVGYREVSVFFERRRQAISIDEALGTLRKLPLAS
ncbi:MAG: PHP domain-containing protein [Planctomycetota bacterium]|nr:MAG: PHP domain-containing protein [Planctomycetota bacterium]